MKGCDYSWDHPDLSCLKNQGVGFIVRYGSRDPDKNLTRSELDSALGLGLNVAVFWQEGKTQMTRGYAGGQQDARDAVALFDDLGLYGIPIHYACDYDPPSSDWPKIDGYLDGTASVHGRDRNGGYGGKAFISREFDNGKIRFGCQTYAWSGTPTQWDSRAGLRQVENDVYVCGGKIDWEESRKDDFGQWPRPSAINNDTVSVFTYNNGEYYAGLSMGGQVMFKQPGGAFFATDSTQSGALSGCGLTIADNGKITISYTNGKGAACIYQRQSRSADFLWDSLSGDNSFR